MKRKGVLARTMAAALLVAGLGRLPVFASEDMHLGVKGGVTWSNFRNADKITNALEDGFSKVDPGAFFWWTASFFCSRDIMQDYVAVQSEFVYTRMGKSWSFSNDGGSERHFELKTDFIQLPILLKFMAPASPYFIPNVYVGPCLSIALRSRSRNMNNLTVVGNTDFFSHLDLNSDDWDYARNAVDGGFVAGAGFQIPTGYGMIDVDLRYNFGEVNIFNFGAGEGIRNYSFMVMLGCSM